MFCPFKVAVLHKSVYQGPFHWLPPILGFNISLGLRFNICFCISVFYLAVSDRKFSTAF